ncbi:aminoacyl-tRNA hydrolase [Bacteroidota bacterium]
MKYLIAGLGNADDRYLNTRHNIGFIVADAFVNEQKGQFTLDRHAYVSSVKYKSRVCIVIKPNTYMNLSGKAVKYWLDKEKIPAENALIIVDDIALPLGLFRMKLKGGDGGHNGLTSIITTLATAEFPRLRIGIGDDFARGYQSDYVLGEWTKAEEKTMIERIPEAVKMIQSFISIGAERTMNLYNKKPE